MIGKADGHAVSITALGCNFPDRIVTQIVPLPAFYPAEDYHQNYATRHPDNPYIVMNDAPKVAHLRQMFPDLYRGQ